MWLNYTNEPNTFYLGPVVIDASAADSDASCAARCNADATCVWWSFCPVLEGCEALAYCNVEDAATTQLLPGGTCLLSADDVRGRIANSAMSGAAVAWSGGKYSPQAGSGDAAGGLGTESGTAMPPEGDISSLSDIAGAHLPALSFKSRPCAPQSSLFLGVPPYTRSTASPPDAPCRPPLWRRRRRRRPQAAPGRQHGPGSSGGPRGWQAVPFSAPVSSAAPN